MTQKSDTEDVVPYWGFNFFSKLKPKKKKQPTKKPGIKVPTKENNYLGLDNIKRKQEYDQINMSFVFHPYYRKFLQIYLLYKEKTLKWYVYRAKGDVNRNPTTNITVSQNFCMISFDTY